MGNHDRMKATDTYYSIHPYIFIVSYKKVCLEKRTGTVTSILRGTRNLRFVLRRSLLRTFETIWIRVITLECSNITASKSIRRERRMIPMELSGVNFSTHGSESECSCFDQVLCIRV